MVLPAQQESEPMPSKSDTLTAIMELNPTATPEFLAQFTNDELARYLRRLQDARGFDPGQRPHSATDARGMLRYTGRAS